MHNEDVTNVSTNYSDLLIYCCCTKLLAKIDTDSRTRTDRSLAAADGGNEGIGLLCARSKDKKWGLFREMNNSYSCKMYLVGKQLLLLFFITH